MAICLSATTWSTPRPRASPRSWSLEGRPARAKSPTARPRTASSTFKPASACSITEKQSAATGTLMLRPDKLAPAELADEVLAKSQKVDSVYPAEEVEDGADDQRGVSDGGEVPGAGKLQVLAGGDGARDLAGAGGEGVRVVGESHHQAGHGNGGQGGQAVLVGGDERGGALPGLGIPRAPGGLTRCPRR